MKNKFAELGKKKLAIVGVAVILAVGGASAAINQPESTSADTSPLVEEVNRHGEQLANHEARITNTENDVSDLQTSTGTPPSPNRVSVPSVSSTTPTTSTPSQPAPTSTPAPAPVPVTVSSAGIVLGGAQDGKCHLYYTDGTDGYVQAIIVNNGSSQSDNCQSFVGQPKS